MNTNCETKTAGNGAETARAVQVIVPRCDIYENADAVHVVAEMPGLAASDVDITLERNVLTISGRHTLQAPEGAQRIWTEFDGGEYRRTFELSERVDSAQLRAEMKDGVLRLSLPKVQPARRKIPVASN
jgi:HSP20 family protein